MRSNRFNVRPDAQDLRKSILFWDLVHLPEQYYDTYLLEPDIQFLSECGIIRSFEGPSVEDLGNRFDGGVDFVNKRGHIPIYSQLRMNLFSTLEKEEEGGWAMGRGISSPELNIGERTAGRGLVVELTNMLPVPVGDVNLNDILEFKAKRSDELGNLRFHISAVFRQASEQDIDAMTRGDIIEEFRKSVIDFQKSMNDSGIVTTLVDLVSSLNVAPLITLPLSIKYPEAGIALTTFTAVTGCITVTPFKGLKRRKTSDVFEYVSKYHRDIGWFNG